MTGPRQSRIPSDAVTDPRFRGRDLQVLCLLGRHTDAKGWCTRSQVGMAEELGCHRTTVLRSIGRLAGFGYLEVEERESDHGGTLAFRYRVKDPVRQAELPLPEADFDPGGVCTDAQGGVHPECTGGVHPGCTPISLNDDSERAALQRARKARSKPIRSKPLPGQRQLIPAVLVAGGAPQPDPNSRPTGQPGHGRDLDGLEAALRAAAGAAVNSASPGLLDLSHPLRWLEGGCDLDRDVLPVIRSRAAAVTRPGRIQGWAYFGEAVIEARDRRLLPIPPPGSPLVGDLPPDVTPLNSRRSAHARFDDPPRESRTRAALRRARGEPAG